MAAVKVQLAGGAVLLALVSAGLTTTNGPAVAAPTAATADSEQVQTSAKYRLKFSDNFSGRKLSSKWAFRNNQAANRACSKPDPRMTKVGGGALTISVKRNPALPARSSACPDGHFLNGMISTENRFEAKYGKFEARIKFNRAKGAHGSFWLQTAGAAPGAKPWDAGKRGTEVDIIEYFGDGFSTGGATSFVYWPRLVNGKTVYQKSGSWIKKSKMRKIFGKGDPSDKYHRYSVEWTPTQYIFRIDGKETYRLKKGVSHVPEYMILSLLSSSYELPHIKNKNLPITMKVDWVKVWQK